MNNNLYSKIKAVKNWYHTVEIGSGLITPGICNTAQLLSLLDFPKDFSGKRVLDLGARDGFFSFEAEKRGAKEIIALDYSRKEDTGFEVLAEAMR